MPRHTLQLALFTMFSIRLVVREEQESLSEVFFAMDLDNDGVISLADFTQSYEIYCRKNGQKLNEA